MFSIKPGLINIKFCILENYVRGEVNTNICPVSGKLILTEDTCKLAAQEFGGDYKSSGSWSSTPKGCYTYTDGAYKGNYYWNTHAIGSSKTKVQPICAKRGW